MRRYSPPYYSPSRRGYGGRPRSPLRRGYGGERGRRKEQNHGSLLVRNIPLDCRPEELRVPFERFGLVRDVYLPKDYYTGEPRGFAFVQFVDPYEAAEAQYQMNGQIFAGREISVVVAAETRKRPEEMRRKARTGGPVGYGVRRSSYYGLALVHAPLDMLQVLEVDIDQGRTLLHQGAVMIILFLHREGMMIALDLQEIICKTETLFIFTGHILLVTMMWLTEMAAAMPRKLSLNLGKQWLTGDHPLVRHQGHPLDPDPGQLIFLPGMADKDKRHKEENLKCFPSSFCTSACYLLSINIWKLLVDTRSMLKNLLHLIVDHTVFFPFLLGSKDKRLVWDFLGV